MISVQEQLSNLRVTIAQEREELGAAAASLVWVPNHSFPFELGDDPNCDKRSKLTRLNFTPLGQLRHPRHSRLGKESSTAGRIFLDPGDDELMALTDDELRNACRLLEGAPKDHCYRVLPRTQVRMKVDRIHGAAEALTLYASDHGRIYFRRNRVRCEELLSQIIVPTVFDAGPTDWAFAWIFEKPFAAATERPDLGVNLQDAFGLFIKCVDELMSMTGGEDASIARGVSLRDIALLLNESDKFAATRTIKRWHNSREPKLPAALGNDTQDSRAELYALSAILRFVKKIEGCSQEQIAECQTKLRHRVRPIRTAD